jgi:pimeloyl-ACP methyl ester carboxylesterase
MSRLSVRASSKQIGRRRGAVAAALGIATVLCGCSPIASVSHHKAAYAPSSGANPAPANQYIATGQRLQDKDRMKALGNYLAAARVSVHDLKSRPQDPGTRRTYNYAVGRCIDIIETDGLDPWSHTLTVAGPDGDFSLGTKRPADSERNPANYRLETADRLTLGGRYFTDRVTVDGLGAPVVAISRNEVPDFRKTTLSSQRIYGVATAFIRFNGQQAQIEFAEPLAQERITLDGHTYPVAADFSAPIAVALVTERPEKLGLIRMLRPEKYAETARLARLQAYDPTRIPVLFVHGLQDTPASWAPMINRLRGDREIRRNYQFWVFSYPSGYPYPYSASLLRRDLDSVKRAFPKTKRMVLVGHSMGGMISRLMITDSGDKIWRDLFGKPPAQTELPASTRKLLEESLIFAHRPEVARVIFISTPQRGADMAKNSIGRIGSSLIRTPIFLAAIPFATLQAAMTVDPGALQLKRMPNSIDTLAPSNRFVQSVNRIPIKRGIPYHSIIGDRGKGDTPNSSDGVVAYWSSHVEGAQSELIVPSNHSAPLNPQAIAEVARILKLNLGTRGKTASEDGSTAVVNVAAGVSDPGR